MRCIKYGVQTIQQHNRVMASMWARVCVFAGKCATLQKFNNDISHILSMLNHT